MKSPGFKALREYQKVQYTCLKVFRIPEFRILRMGSIESQPQNPELDSL